MAVGGRKTREINFLPYCLLSYILIRYLPIRYFFSLYISYLPSLSLLFIYLLRLYLSTFTYAVNLSIPNLSISPSPSPSVYPLFSLYISLPSLSPLFIYLFRLLSFQLLYMLSVFIYPQSLYLSISLALCLSLFSSVYLSLPAISVHDFWLKIGSLFTRGDVCGRSTGQ